jgi:repressor LexA
MALTKRQKQILDYVESFLESYGYSPSFEEIAANFGYSSLATVHEHLSNLERKGYLRKNYNKSRSLELVPPRVRWRWSCRCSAPWPPACRSKRSRSRRRWRPARHAARREQLRAPRARRLDGRRADPRWRLHRGELAADGHDGEMVVALVGGDSATVKKLYRERDGRVRLQPANATMQPMYYDSEDEVQIQGIVIAVIRKY